MEQNKVLMVIVSVAIFFAAIIGVGVALLYPGGDETTDVAGGRAVREFDPIEYVRNPEDAPLRIEDQEDPVVIVYGEQDEEPVALETPQTGAVADAEVMDGEAGSSAEDSPTITITERPARNSVNEPDGSAAAPSAPAEAPTETGAATAVAADPAPATPPQPREIRVTEYWIQLIASPSRDRVEQARGTLADYSLGGRVTTRDVDGQLYYRLRVGPYESEGEAEKFLDWIRDIEGFDGAYISEEYPLRSVTS